MNDEAFWRFAWERQAVWHRRFVERRPWPWTSDETLARYRFCNVHRELDATTQALLVNLRDHASSHPNERVFNVMLFRAYNAPDVPWVRSREEALAVVAERETRWRAGEKRVFGAAWMITGGRTSPPNRVRDGVERWDPGRVVRVCSETSTLRDVMPVVVRQSFFGRMTGWQVTLDLTYVFSHLSDDEWLPIPPDLHGNPHRAVTYSHGPLAAVRRLDVDRPFADVAHELRDRQEERLGELGLRWSDVAWSAKPRLTLADVEHTLCEYHKYETIRERPYGRARRYVPGT